MVIHRPRRHFRRPWHEIRPLPEVVFLLLALYAVTNRLIPDVVTIPGPVSLHPSEMILMGIVIVLMLQQVVDPQPVPGGSVALAGILLLAVLLVGPYLNASTLTPSEIRNFDQGVVTAVLLAGLLVASYQVGVRPHHSRAVLTTVITVSAIQGLIGVVEGLTRKPVTFVARMWTALGLQSDPRSARTFVDELNARLTGELRASSTAPHPLVLSAIMAVSCLISAHLFLVADRGPRKVALGLATMLTAGALGFSNSRTGMLVFVAACPLLVMLHARRPARLMTIAVAGAAGVALIGLLSPSTVRIALDTITFVERDHNLDVRIDRWPLVVTYLEDRPFVGAGLYTNDAEVRQLWDNAYLHALSEVGMLGLAGFLALFGSLTSRAFTLLRSRGSSDPPPEAVAGMLAGLGLFVAGLTLDAWTFDQFLPMCLLLLGLSAGGLDRPRAHVADGVSSGRSQ